MSGIDRFCSPYRFFIPLLIAGFVTSEQKKPCSTWIEDIEHTEWTACVLDTQFLQIGKL